MTTTKEIQPQVLRRVLVENFLKITLAEIDPDGELVLLNGENDQGKSSILKAIAAALLGRIAFPIDPVHDDADHAYVELTFDRFVIQRTIYRDGRFLLKVLSNDPRLTSTQATLDAFLGQITFNPFDFAEAPAKDQARMLREALGIDTTALDSERAKAFDERTVVNRLLKTAEGAVASHPAAPAEADESPVDIQGLLDDQEAVQEQLAVLSRKIREAQTGNAAIEKAKGARERHLELQNEVTKQRRAAEALTQAIAKIDAKKKALLASVEMPIAGMELEEERVLFNGHPIEQAGNGTNLDLAVKLGFALNPEIRVALIPHGSLMDRAALERVARGAAEAGGQAWVERVGTEGPVGFVIEAGEVVSRPAKKAQAARKGGKS